MRRLLLAAISAVLTYLIVVMSYDVVLAGRDPLWYFAYFLTLFVAINSGLRRLPDRRAAGNGRAL